MDCLFGIVGKDFVLLAADNVTAHSIVVLKSDDASYKLRPLSLHNAIAFCGEPGDTVNFAEYLQANVALYGIRNEGELGTKATAHFARKTLADSLRSRKPYQVNVLIGGVERVLKRGSDDPREGELCPRLFWIDYLAAMIEVPFAAHGYGAYFCMSLLDRHYRKGMNEEEAMNLLKMCFRELATRFIINLPTFSVRIIRVDGIESISELKV